MILSSLFVIAGLLLLVYGGDALVTGATNIARRFGISELIVGLTIVAFGTSAPELVVNSMAAFEQHPELVLGNVIGSNNFNLFVVLGISGVIAPLAVSRNVARRDIPLSLAFAVLALLMGNDFFAGDGATYVSRIDAAVLAALMAGYIYMIFRDALKNKNDDFVSAPDMNLGRAVLLVAIGLGALIGGGKLVLNGAVDIATQLGVSERVIGLTIVAAGTSLPELVTSIVACRKKSVDIAIGNAIGSNIFNLLLILGVSGLLSPIEYESKFNNEIALLCGGTLLLWVAAMGKKHRLEKWQALILVGAYVGYTATLLL